MRTVPLSVRILDLLYSMGFILNILCYDIWKKSLLVWIYFENIFNLKIDVLLF